MSFPALNHDYTQRLPILAANYWPSSVGSDTAMTEVGGRAPMAVESVNGGALVVQQSGENVTITLVANTPKVVSFDAIIASGSAAHDLTVYW